MSYAGMDRIRWGFGPRVAVADEEAAIDITPLLQSDGSFPHDDDADECPRATVVDYNQSTPLHPVSPSITEIPITHSPLFPAVIPNPGPVLSVLQSFRLSNLYRCINRYSLLPSTNDDQCRAQMASQASDGARVSPSHILAPILGDLQKLKALTPESLPPYNPNFNTKSYAQVLKERLLPIGKFIAGYLDGVPEAQQGNLEMRICRFIADEYWPLPVDNFTHLKIQEKYRNAFFKKATFGVSIAGPPPGDIPPPKDTSSSNVRLGDAAYNDAPPTESSPSRPSASPPPVLESQSDCNFPCTSYM